MPAADTLLAFFLATLVFAYMPGPAMLFASAQTIARGPRAGMMAVLGIHVGGYVHVAAATFGLAALFELVPPLYLALKIIGAAYLIWLGAQMILTRHGQVTSSSTLPAPSRAFRQGITVEVLNPKAALFFVAFLPQFSDPAASFPIWAQLLILGTVVNLTFGSADVICVVLAHRMARLVQGSRRAQARIKALGGSILVGLGLTVALDR
ncbi:MAG: LysE family translocator [Pseudomonadota bacterium]